MMSLAIDCSEDAYDRIKNMLEKPNNRDEDKFFTKICSNLCYYYGMGKKETKFYEGLVMAKLSLKKGQKYNHLNWIDNYLYFITQFIFHPELEKKEVDSAKKILQKHKISLIAQAIRSKDEINSFEDTFSTYTYREIEC